MPHNCILPSPTEYAAPFTFLRMAFPERPMCEAFLAFHGPLSA